MKKIITFTGPSGSGKTTLAKWILASVPESCMIPSHTTRKKRESDLPGEYRYVDSDWLNSPLRMGTFLWEAEHGGNQYRTMEKSINDFLGDSNTSCGIMILTPEVIPILARFLDTTGKEVQHIPIFVTPPSREVLVERLKRRGESDESIKARLDGGAGWEVVARRSSVSYKYIKNDTSIEAAVNELRAVLSV